MGAVSGALSAAGYVDFSLSTFGFIAAPRQEAQDACERNPGMRTGTSPIESSASLQTSIVNLSMAAATGGDGSVSDPLRAYDPTTGRSTLMR